MSRLSTALIIVVVLTVFAQGAFAAISCSDVHFWVEEGQFLFGDLQNAQTRNQDFHDKGFYTVSNDQHATSGCASVSFALKNGVGPAHHTVTPAAYTPKVDAFALTATGTFTFVNLPTIGTPEVWNGYTSFGYTATCSDNSVCEGTAYINVVFTSASTHNSPKPSFSAGYGNYVTCTGTCATTMAWKARHTLPRLWDVMATETGSIPQATVQWDGVTENTDGLNFEWSSNFALITTYGAIGNMGVRFPTMEVVTFTPGQWFHGSDYTGVVADASTGFNLGCLSNANQGTAGTGSQVWDTANVALGTEYNSGTSWYHKFGGKHTNCDVFNNGYDHACKYAPLLTPRPNQVEDNVGVWKLAINGCVLRWQAKFTWNAMRKQGLSSSTGAKAWDIKAVTEGCTGVVCTGFGGWQLTANMYNEAVQPNSWTQPHRGFAWIDHKYMLKIILNTDTDFKFELGIDIFTVDLQHFRYDTSNGDHAFGYNMIVYPKTLNDLQQSAPDRRIQGFNWVENYWFAPTAAQCSTCKTSGMVTPSTIATGHCTNSEGAHSLYINQFPAGSCGANAVVTLEKGPATSTQCDATDPMYAYVGRPGISKQDPCLNTFQNITLRGVATGSAGKADFGFEGRIVLTFLLENGEHPHFQIDPKMYVKSLCIEGGFAGTSHTCRGSPKWPVANPELADLSDLPKYICEEVDARTFGPTDWAFIFFDIKDVDADLVSVKKLRIVVNSVPIVFIGTVEASEFLWTTKYKYFNFRNLKGTKSNGLDLLVAPTHPSGSALPPQKTDFGFGFTPGAHNENIKITIYATLTILSSTTTAANKNRRFASAEEKETDNTVQESININNRGNQLVSSLLSRNQADASATSEGSSSSSSVTVTVLAVACAVLVAAVIGMAVFLMKRPDMAPKRVNSNV